MALIAQLGEHCTGTAEVVGSNPAQSLKIFSGLCSSSVTAALALMTVKNCIAYVNLRYRVNIGNLEFRLKKSSSGNYELFGEFKDVNSNSS